MDVLNTPPQGFSSASQGEVGHPPESDPRHGLSSSASPQMGGLGAGCRVSFPSPPRAPHRGSLAERMAVTAERASRLGYHCTACNATQTTYGDGSCVSYDFENDRTCGGQLEPGPAPEPTTRRCHDCQVEHDELEHRCCAACRAKRERAVEEMSGDELWPLLEIDVGGEG